MFGRLPLRKYFLPDVLRTAEEVGGHRALKCRWQLALECLGQALGSPKLVHANSKIILSIMQQTCRPRHSFLAETSRLHEKVRISSCGLGSAGALELRPDTPLVVGRRATS